MGDADCEGKGVLVRDLRAEPADVESKNLGRGFPDVNLAPGFP